MAKQKKKRWDGIIYTDASSSAKSHYQSRTLSPAEQLLYISIDRKQRKGKEVTLIEGFRGTLDDMVDLSKTLKTRCGVGGSAKDGQIILQGNVRDKVMDYLAAQGYEVKRKGG